MYEDNNFYGVKINWKSLLLKLILVILFVLLIVFLFPMPKLDTFYNRVFNDNIQTMKDAAKNYYSGDNLPLSIGDSSSLSLEDMLNKNLIVEFVDKDNNKCSNTNSYAQITKTGEKDYVLKVQLSCGSQTDYILENIGIYNTCSSGNCLNNSTTITSNDDKKSNSSNENTSVNTSNSLNNDEDDDEDKVLENATYDKDGNLVGLIEYEFKKPIYSTSNSYSCPDGYVLDGTKCYKEETGETIKATALYFEDSVLITDAKKNETGEYTEYVDAIKKEDGYSEVCPEGYTKNGSTCYKYVEATVTPGTTTYSCPDGYKLDGTKCIQTIDATITGDVSYSYTCPNGGTLSGKTCNYSATYSGGNSSCTCPSGGSLSGSTCNTTSSYAATYHGGNTSCSCPSGGSLSGSTCYTSSNYGATYHAGNTSCSCPSGGSLSGSTCNKSSSYAASKNSYWSNPSVSTSYSALSVYNNGSEKRVLANKSCTLSRCTYTYYTYRLISNYTCSSGGSLSGSTCYVNSSYAASCSTSNGYYSCPSGGSLSGSNCVKSSSYAASCSTSNGYYSCPSGGSLSGSNCVKSSSYAASCSTSSGSYSCPNGGSLSGSNCSYAAKENVASSQAISCPSGYTLNGRTCTKTIDATKNTSQTTYSCPSGYTKDGTTCYKTTDIKKETNYKYSCPEGYDTRGEKEDTTCYKKVASTVDYYCEDKDSILKEKSCIKTIKGVLKGYTCPSDYILSNEECYKKTKVYIDAIIDKNTKVTYQYKWSTSKTLDGWTATGRTRTTEATEYIK